MAEPPLAGAVHATVAAALPVVAVGAVGVAGAVAAGGGATGLTTLLPVEYALVPIALVAATRKVYAVPLVSPVTVVVSTLPTGRSAPTWVVPVNTRSV